MGGLPPHIRDSVVRDVYADCDRLLWETLDNAAKSRQYTVWMGSPSVGLKLAQCMKPERVRVWLKDGPCKEYRRAINGQGPYSKYTTRRLSSPESVVERALGRSWSVVQGSLAEKPLQCEAVDASSGKTRRIFWGSTDNVKDLVWAALLSKADGNDNPLVVFVRGPGELTPVDVESRLKQVASAAGIGTVFVVDIPAKQKSAG